MKKVYVILEGGCVQSVLSNDEDIDITIIDHDDEGWSEDNSSITREVAYEMTKKDNVKGVAFKFYGTNNQND